MTKRTPEEVILSLEWSYPNPGRPSDIQDAIDCIHKLQKEIQDLEDFYIYRENETYPTE